MPQDGQDGPEENAQIDTKGHVPRVPDVHLKALLPRNRVAPVRLRIAGEAGAHVVAVMLFFVVARKILDQKWTWPDNGHVPLEDVPKFRQLVQRGRAQELAIGDETLLVWKRVAVGVRLAGHRAELDKPEDFLVFPRAFLRKKRVTLHNDGADDCQHQEHRRQKKQRRQGKEEVKNTFEIVAVQRKSKRRRTAFFNAEINLHGKEIE